MKIDIIGIALKGDVEKIIVELKAMAKFNEFHLPALTPESVKDNIITLTGEGEGEYTCKAATRRGRVSLTMPSYEQNCVFVGGGEFREQDDPDNRLGRYFRDTAAVSEIVYITGRTEKILRRIP